MEEKKRKRDLVFQLLEKEWDMRMEKIIQTGKYETEDFLRFGVIELNDELGDIGGYLKRMATKDDVKTLKWGIGIGFTALGLVIALLSLCTYILSRV